MLVSVGNTAMEATGWGTTTSVVTKVASRPEAERAAIDGDTADFCDEGVMGG